MKRGLIVSDLHSGSMYALLPPNMKAYDETERLWNPCQKYLWQCWDHFSLTAEEFKPDFVIVNGDCVEGPQKKSNGFELTLSSMDDQKKACIGTLRHLQAKIPHAKWYFTSGTPYHVGEWHNIEEDIAREMGATTYWSVGTGEYCREILWLNCEGILIEATHHITSSKLAALEREDMLSLLASNNQRKGMPRADVLIRSHVHEFGYAAKRSQQMFTTPCWKLGDRHSRKSSPHNFLPEIGGVFMEIERTKDRPICHISEQLYDLPKIRIADL